jgi:hypothetical protein
VKTCSIENKPVPVGGGKFLGCHKSDLHGISSYSGLDCRETRFNYQTPDNESQKTDYDSRLCSGRTEKFDNVRAASRL